VAARLAKEASWAIVTSATKSDTWGKVGISPEDRVGLIDVTSNLRKIVQSMTFGSAVPKFGFAPVAAWRMAAGLQSVATPSTGVTQL
jgi:hypothetical protein